MCLNLYSKCYLGLGILLSEELEHNTGTNAPLPSRLKRRYAREAVRDELSETPAIC